MVFAQTRIWDFGIQTFLQIPVRRLDLVLLTKKKKKNLFSRICRSSGPQMNIKEIKKMTNPRNLPESWKSCGHEDDCDNKCTCAFGSIHTVLEKSELRLGGKGDRLGTVQEIQI